VLAQEAQAARDQALGAVPLGVLGARAGRHRCRGRGVCSRLGPCLLDQMVDPGAGEAS
jgi:hypothetical protein